MLPVLRHSFTRRIFATLVFELLALNGCFTVLVFSSGAYWSQTTSPTVLAALFALTNTLVIQFSLWSFGLYSRGVIYSGHGVFPNLTSSFIFSSVLLFPIYYLFRLSGEKVFDVTLGYYLFSLLGYVSVVGVERALVLKLFQDWPYLGKILILGSGPATAQVIAEARRHHGKSIRVVGVLSEAPDEVGQWIDGCPIIGTIDQIPNVVRENDIHMILISIPIYSLPLPTGFLLKCKLSGIAVQDCLDFYETMGKKVLLEKLDPIQFLLSENLLMSRFRWTLKACCEKLIAILLLVCSSPLLLLTALMMKLTSRGPVLYQQERVGKDGNTFKLIKFRSMVQGAESNGEAVWAQKNDPRVTPIGKIIRKFRIDELPQLINVFRGEMAIVGPRPERPEFVRQLTQSIAFYNERHLVPPGITGWAQVAYPYGSSFEDSREKLRYDLYYIKHMSLLFDLMIVLSTIRTVLFGKGAR